MGETPNLLVYRVLPYCRVLLDRELAYYLFMVEETMKKVTLQDFERRLLDAANKYTAEYLENNDGNPEDWPTELNEGAFFEDFLCWLEFKGIVIP